MRSRRAPGRILVAFAIGWIMINGPAHSGTVTSSESLRPAAAFSLYLPLVPQPEPPVQIAYSYLTRPRQSPFQLEGEIRNVASSTVYSVTLSARFYDDADNWLGTYGGGTAFIATFPGETNRFSIWTELYDAEPSSYEVVVDGWTMASAFEYKPVTVVSVEVEQEPISTLVSGEIRNEHPRDMRSIRLMVEPGTNGPYQFADLETTVLAPGGTTTYTSLIIHPWEPPPGHVSVHGQGYLNR